LTITSPESIEIQVADHVRRLRPYHPGRPIEDVKREHRLSDIIKLASNENPLGPSSSVIRAMREACERAAVYPDDNCFELRQKLSKRLEVDPEMLIFGRGSDEVIHDLGLAFLEPGDEVVQAHPTFSRYEAAAILGQANCISVPLKDYTHDLDAMAAAFTARTRLVFIANPNNPTGTMNTQSEVDRLMDRLPPRAIAVFDEAYFEYVEDTRYPDTLRYVREGRPVVVLRTFSKIYALAGLRIGYGIATTPLIRFLNQVRDPFNVNVIAQAAAAASLDDPEQVERSRRLNREAKEYLLIAFRELGLEAIPSVANFLMVDTRRPASAVCKGLERRGVIVRSGEPFGMPSFIRVTTGTIPECDRFVQALRHALSD